MFEITFVMVITLLLAALVAMGQHITTDLKVNRLDHDLHRLQAAIYDSQDRLHPARGNLYRASLHSTDSADVGDGRNWNEIFGANWEPASGKTFNLWQRGEAMGKHSNAYVPLKSPGASTDAPKTFGAPIAGLRGDYIICTDNIAGGLVRQLDREMDDGDTASGAMMVSNIIGGKGITADNIDDSSAYVVCLGV